MYITDIVNDFYNFLAGKRIFLMVHYDIDSICACKILQHLLKFKHIIYSVAVITGVDDVKMKFRENSNDVKYFILINCGGTVDLVDVLEPQDDAIFFVLDAHKPTDLANIYSPGQVRLLNHAEDDSEAPEIQDIYSEDESDEEGDIDASSSSDSEQQSAKRRRLGEGAILKRREKRLWRDKRDKLLFDYYQFTYYSKACALLIYDLAWKLNQDNKELLWFAITAITEQYLTGKIDDSLYVLESNNLLNHSNRLRNRINDQQVLSSLKITYEEDVKLVLYRYWSIMESLKYSMHTACTMRLWSHQGSAKLNELLADMGFPLVQSKQAFHSMDLQLRKEFLPSFQKQLDKYNLQDIVYTTFVLQYGYRNKYCAADMVYAMLAILEFSAKDKSVDERFSLALDCLSRNNDLILSGISSAKTISKVIFKTVQKAIEMREVITAGPFMYYIIPEGFLDWYMFSHQHVLLLLAQFLLRALVRISNARKMLALVVSAPKNIETGTCILLGVPPLIENSPKSFFGKAFQRTADQINCDSSYDFFDTSFFEIYTKDRPRFLDALTSLLS